MKVALVENFGSDFVGARLRFALFLKEEGIDVTAVIPQDGHKKTIEESGINVIEVASNIRGKGLFNKFSYAKNLKSIIKREKFNIVHLYRLQPNLIGTPIAFFYSKSKIVNHVTGLGLVFISDSFKNKLLKFAISGFYRLNSLFFRPYVIFQNEQDIVDLGIKKRVYCIRGSAVNEDRFQSKEISTSERNHSLKEKFGVIMNSGDKVLIFVSRLLKQKGVIELIEALKRINSSSQARFIAFIVGWRDENNPASVKTKNLKELIKGHESNILFLGKRSDVDELIALSDISILPTYYREGTPRFLLESMSMGKPIITTNMPGCDHLVSSEDPNGLLIEPKNSDSIVKALGEIREIDLKKMGKNSAMFYRQKFSENIVYSSILELYEKIRK